MNKRVTYTNNIDIRANITLSHEDVKDIKDLLEQCKSDIQNNNPPKNISDALSPPNSNHPPNLYNIATWSMIRQQQRQYSSLDDLLEAAKTNEELMQVNNISIFHFATGISININSGYVSMSCPNSHIDAINACALSIISILTRNLKIPYKYGMTILSIMMFLTFVLAPATFVAMYIGGNIWWAVLLILPALYLRYWQTIDWRIYTRFINRGSTVELFEGIKKVKSEKRQKALGTAQVIFSLLGGSAIVKIVYDLIVGQFMK